MRKIKYSINANHHYYSFTIEVDGAIQPGLTLLDANYDVISTANRILEGFGQDAMTDDEIDYLVTNSSTFHRGA